MASTHLLFSIIFIRSLYSNKTLLHKDFNLGAVGFEPITLQWSVWLINRWAIICNRTYFLLCDAHLVSPVHEHHVGFLFGKFLHLLGGLAGDPLPLGHLVTPELILQCRKGKAETGDETSGRMNKARLKRIGGKRTVAILRLSRMCILSTSFSGTRSALSRYAKRPVG